MRRLLAICGVALALAMPAQAQSVQSEITASNGVVVTLYADEFAERYEYSAPLVRFDDGFALVARINRGGSPGPIHVQGVFSYSGDWRYYSSAVFRGGDRVSYEEGAREVGRCSGSRYGSSCSLSESFSIDLSPEEIESHARDGVLEMQVRASRTSDTALISIPLTYFEAVREVSSRPRD